MDIKKLKQTSFHTSCYKA